MIFGVLTVSGRGPGTAPNLTPRQAFDSIRVRQALLVERADDAAANDVNVAWSFVGYVYNPSWFTDNKKTKN